MKRAIFLIFSSALILQIGFSQSAPGFNKRFTTPYPNSRIFKMLIEHDTIIALGIGYEDTISTQRGIVLMKLDTFGSLITSKFLYDSLFAPPPLEIVWGSLLKANDGGYVMSFRPDLLAFPAVLKTDHDFNTVFIKKYQNLSGNNYSQMEMKSLSDGYLLHGSFRQPTGISDGYVGKIDFNGEAVWFKNYGNIATNETIADVKIMNDTTYVVAMVKSTSQPTLASSILVIDKEGEILQSWTSPPNPEIGILRSIISADTNGYLVYGLWSVEPLPINMTNVKSTISKLDENFNLKWSKKYGKEVFIGSDIMFYNFERTVDGNFVAAGRTSTVPTFEGGPTYARGWLMKFSPDGDSIWSRLDTSDLTPWHILNSHRLGGVGVLSSGSIVAGGYARHLNDYYAWLVKVTNDGCLDTLYCGLVSGVAAQIPQKTNLVNVYPNPATTYLEMDYDAKQGTKATILLSNLLGKVVGKFDFEGNNTHHVIPLHGLPNGPYFYTILQGGRQVHVGKFIKLE